MPAELGSLWMIVPALLIALIFHPNLNNNFFTDSAWAFALYLEAVAILPQVAMFQRSQDREVEIFTANFVFGVAVARILSFSFWLSSYHELNNKYADAFHQRYPGVLVVGGQIVNLLLLADYVYAYLRNARTGGPVLLPQTI